MDFYYLILVIPAIAFSGLVGIMFKSTLAKYSKVASQKGLTGQQTAVQMLQLFNINDVPVGPVKGTWSDHYARGKMKDGTITKRIGLSEPVFGQNSISAIAVAAHEVGHAIQYEQKYALIMLRSKIRPIANFGSKFGPWLAGAGVAFGLEGVGVVLLDIGIILFAGAVLLSLLTLPSELNASSRALAILRDNNMLDQSELKGAKKALNAAAMTYFAGLLTNFASFLRLLLLRKSRKRK